MVATAPWSARASSLTVDHLVCSMTLSIYFDTKSEEYYTQD
uniref:Uncharacterized protein n=1 Tax=Lepeophtheirus salmonis TaxID=72036 RepID=A0A0K2UIC2_LEPSM